MYDWSYSARVNMVQSYGDRDNRTKKCVTLARK